MIAIRYQIFFVDPNEEKPNQLSAVQPMFSSPAAVDTLIKTLKFENRKPLVLIGDASLIDKLLEKVQRLDVTDWDNYSSEQRLDGVKSMAAELGLETREDGLRQPGQQDNQVLGLEPKSVEAQAQSTKYPTDLPEKHRPIWNSIKRKYSKFTEKAKDAEEKEAIFRIVYEHAAKRSGHIPWAPSTGAKITENRSSVRDEIVVGEEKGSKIAESLLEGLVHDGLVKKVKPQKFFSTDYDAINSKYVVIHSIDASLHSDWVEVCKWLLHKKEFRKRSNTELTLAVDKTTQLIVKDHPKGVTFHIVHSLAPFQASSVTQETKEDKILAKLNKTMKIWYKSGKFPELQKMDTWWAKKKVKAGTEKTFDTSIGSFVVYEDRTTGSQKVWTIEDDEGHIVGDAYGKDELEGLKNYLSSRGMSDTELKKIKESQG